MQNLLTYTFSFKNVKNLAKKYQIGVLFGTLNYHLICFTGPDCQPLHVENKLTSSTCWKMSTINGFPVYVYTVKTTGK